MQRFILRLLARRPDPVRMAYMKEITHHPSSFSCSEGTPWILQGELSVPVLLKWHWDSCSNWFLFWVSDVTKFDKSFSSCTITLFTTRSELLIDPSANVRLTVDGNARILSSFPISYVGVKFIPSRRLHWASFMDNFPIELILPGSFFFRGNHPWNIVLQLPVKIARSFLFNFYGYDNLLESGSLQGFSLSSRICRLLILKMESLSTRGSNIGGILLLFELGLKCWLHF